MRAQLIAYVAIAVMATGCHSASTVGSSPAAPSAVTQIPTTGSVVIGRAPQPTQVNATGIRFTSGSLNVKVYNNSINIPARDWNTITNTSIVPQDIEVSIDPDIHATETTRNRLQYLADRMYPFIKKSFRPIGIASSINGTNDQSIVAFVNPTADIYEIAGLTLSVKQGPPETTVSSANFYTTPDTALTVSAKTIYFAWLSAPVSTEPRRSATGTSYDFNWQWLYDCGEATCPRASV